MKDFIIYILPFDWHILAQFIKNDLKTFTFITVPNYKFTS